MQHCQGFPNICKISVNSSVYKNCIKNKHQTPDRNGPNFGINAKKLENKSIFSSKPGVGGEYLIKVTKCANSLKPYLQLDSWPNHQSWEG